MIPQDFSLPCYDSAMGNQLVLFTIERLSYDQALHASSHACELLIAKEMVGASGFEPPSSWSRTSLDQAKSVELTAFACAFPRLIWATWATKYRRRISGCSPSRMYEDPDRGVEPVGPMTGRILGSSSTRFLASTASNRRMTRCSNCAQPFTC